MTTITTESVVSCLWCDHAETGTDYAPYDAIEAHQIDTHGQRKMACGCRYVADDRTSTTFHWWTCDQHSVGRIRQITALQLANHYARRWVTSAAEKVQPSLFAKAGA